MRQLKQSIFNIFINHYKLSVSDSIYLLEDFEDIIKNYPDMLNDSPRQWAISLYNLYTK